MHFLGSAIGVTFGIGLSAAVLPAALSVLGFTKAGIAAGSLAAKMMSAAAVSNGGAVAPGSFVAIAQSLGAAGLPTAVKTTVTAICAAIGAAVL